MSASMFKNVLAYAFQTKPQKSRIVHYRLQENCSISTNTDFGTNFPNSLKTKILVIELKELYILCHSLNFMTN